MAFVRHHEVEVGVSKAARAKLARDGFQRTHDDLAFETPLAAEKDRGGIFLQVVVEGLLRLPGEFNAVSKEQDARDHCRLKPPLHQHGDGKRLARSGRLLEQHPATTSEEGIIGGAEAPDLVRAGLNILALEAEVRRVGNCSEGGCQRTAPVLAEIGATFEVRSRRKADNGPGVAKFLAPKREEVDRLNGIIDRFLSFARPRELNLELFNINKVLKAVLKLIEKEILQSNISVQTKFGQLPEMYLDYDQMEQVILNIIINAIDSMPNGGTLKIFSTFYENSGIIEIGICDTGEGILSESFDKIFEPFFTTKDKGTGLGLAICSRIVENHNGIIEVSSTPQIGTKFIIKLPINNERKGE